MTQRYKARRHKMRESYESHMHRFGWIVVCLLVASVLSALWVQLQALKNENVALRKQLATAVAPSQTCVVVGKWAPNQTKQLSLNVKGTLRTYLIHLPEQFERSRYYPLVMFYAGRGATAQAAQLAYDLDRLPAIIVYPSATVGAQGMTAWEGAPYSSGADDIAFTSAILDQTQSDLCIDRTHVYAAGMSNGGGFAALLSCRLPNKFAAIAIASGAVYPPESGCVTPRPVPLISIHGDRDPTVPYNGSLTRRLPPIEKWVASRAAMNGCTKSSTTYTSADTVQTSWTGCKDGATVQNVRIEGGGHAWGGVPNTSLWRFLSGFSL